MGNHKLNWLLVVWFVSSEPFYTEKPQSLSAKVGSNGSVLSVPLKVTPYGPIIWWPSRDCEALAFAS